MDDKQGKSISLAKIGWPPEELARYQNRISQKRQRGDKRKKRERRTEKRVKG